MKAPRKSPAGRRAKLSAVKDKDAWKLEFIPLDPKAFTDGLHDLGEVINPENQAKVRGAKTNPWRIAACADKALAALAGSGPRQEPPHFLTLGTLQGGLARLRDHANAGDVDAFNLLGYLVEQVVADFTEVARRRPALAGQWGANRSVVPVLTGRNKGHCEELAETFARFRVGEKSPWRVNPENKQGGHTFSARTQATRVAARLCQHLDLYRGQDLGLYRLPIPIWARMASKLPELKKEHARQWHQAAWELLLTTTKEEPETWFDFGDAREKESEGVGAQRSGIKSRLFREIRRMARV